MTSLHRDSQAGTSFAVSRRTLMMGLTLLMGVIVLDAGLASANHRIMTADKAKVRLERGQMMLIDVRSPQEWRQTGIAPGASKVTIHDPGGLPGFVDAVKATVSGNLDEVIAVICASGGRSTIVHQALPEAGFTRVMNIREGMLGGPYGPGWFPRGLPVEPCRNC